MAQISRKRATVSLYIRIFARISGGSGVEDGSEKFKSQVSSVERAKVSGKTAKWQCVVGLVGVTWW